MTDPSELQYLGNGPSATGGGGGWRMSAQLFLRCPQCREFISADPDRYEHCRCGLLSKDPDVGRVGTGGRDDAIEVYRLSTTATGDGQRE